MKKLSLSVLVLSFVSLSVLAQTEQKGINNVNNGMPNRISMNVTTAKQTQNNNFGEKVNAGLHAAGNVVASGASMAAAPGQPIGGIVVKGGQNPTQGVTEDHRTYTGGRKNDVGTTAISSDRSISEKGVKRTEAAVAIPGSPIGGVVVKRGKN